MAVFHLKHPRKKHESNSLRGIAEAKRRGYDEIDIDMTMDAEGNIYGNHWPRPMIHDGFRDPLRRMPKTMRIDDMTPAQVRRLVAVTRGRVYRIQRIERLMRSCARKGIGVVLEPKGTRFRDDAIWRHLSAVADDLGAHVRVYGFDDESLAAAKRAGFKVRALS